MCKSFQIQSVVLIAITLVFFQTGLCEENKPQPKRSTEIKYINPNVPDVDLPKYSGQRYEAMVPDTLDLQDMARLGINGLPSQEW